MTPWKPYSRNYDQSWEPSAGSLIRTPWWSFLSWEKFGQNKSQALGPAILRSSSTTQSWVSSVRSARLFWAFSIAAAMLAFVIFLQPTKFVDIGLVDLASSSIT